MARKSFLTAALAGSLAVGGVLGWGALGPVASAQTARPSASATATPTAAAAQVASASPAAATTSLQTQFLDQLAASLGIQRSALDSAIASAGTSTVDAALAQGTLTQAQADALKARIAAGDAGALWSGRGGRGGPRVAGLHNAMVAAAAQTLNITVDELETALRDGQTLAQLAQAHGTTEQAVIDAALAAAKTQLDQAVAAGTLTQAQADSTYANLQARGANVLRGGHGGRGGRDGDKQAPTPSPSASAAATT